METKQAQRIQTSFLNGVEKKILVALAKRQPRWMTSDILTGIGFVGALLIAAGYILSKFDINWLWLSSFGLLVNWYGDSLDGTLARVRNCQRPVYGYYVDHTVDCINEGLMFIGAGLSGLVRLDLTLIAYVLYLFLTINVSINAHLKGEFKLTYAKLGPTEFRLLIILANTLLIAFPGIRTVAVPLCLAGQEFILSALDLLALVIIAVLAAIYLSTVISDARHYAAADPPKDGRNACQ
ncbi:MAG: CDP-alcohol phosphatidyltransferase [Bacteroidales bacterium]|nr:CDP-alcohol phosphatidyltransferase [Bacteroidales bacterium]